MAVVEELVAKISADTSGLRTQLNAANQNLSRFGSKGEKSVKKVEKSLTAAKVAAGAFAGFIAFKLISVMGKLASSTVDTITEFERLDARLKTATGSTEDAAKTFAAINELATTTPFSIQEITNAYIKLRNLGLDPTKEALISFGNTAAATAKPLGMVIEAVADAAVGDFERLKNSFEIKSRVMGDNIAFTFRGVTTTVGNNTKEIEGFLRDIGDIDYAGAMKEQADTLGVGISNLGIAFDDLKKFIGDIGLTAFLSDGTGGLTRFVKSVKAMIVDFVNGFHDIDAAISVVVTGLLKMYNSVLANFNGLISILDNFSEAVSGIMGGVKDDILNALNPFSGKEASLSGAKKAWEDAFSGMVTAGHDEAMRTLDKENAALDSALNDSLIRIGLKQDKNKDLLKKKEGDFATGDTPDTAPKDPFADTFLGNDEKREEELQKLTDYFLTRDEIELNANQSRIEQIQAYLDSEVEMTDKQKGELMALSAQHSKVIASIEQKANKKKTANDKNAFLSTLSQAAGFNKVFFNLNKAAKIANALIDARQSVVSAYAWGSEIGGPPVGALAAGVAAAAQAANIASIASSSFGGGGGVGSGGGGGSFSSTDTQDTANNNDNDASAQDLRSSRNIEITINTASGYVPEESLRLLSEQLKESLEAS